MLETLEVGGNPIKKEGLLAIAEHSNVSAFSASLNNPDYVQALSRHAGNMDPDVMRALASSLKIKQLDLSNNQLKDTDAMLFKGNTTLKHLDVSNNQLTVDGAEHLIIGTTCQSLNLNSNDIDHTDAVKQRLLIALEQNNTLETLDIHTIDHPKKLNTLLQTRERINDVRFLTFCSAAKIMIAQNAPDDMLRVIGSYLFSSNVAIRKSPIKGEERRRHAENAYLSSALPFHPFWANNAISAAADEPDNTPATPSKDNAFLQMLLK